MSLLIDLLAAGSPGSGTSLWSTWQAAADLAGSRPRLVFVGDALDHWSSTLAATLNADVPLMTALAEVFVCVAVDAAAEPQLAAMVQHALQLTAATTGLPAIAICTPEGQPFGATPWRRAHDLAQVLFQAAEAWHQRPADCRADAARIAAAAANLRQPATATDRPLNATLLLEAAEAAAMDIADPLAGGFGPPPRTAEPALWNFLIQRASRPNAPLALIQQVERSLAAVVAGAAHDHLAGGFFHGCEDAAWTVPRCAKRLTDQAHLALMLLDAATGLERPVWRDVAERTLEFVVAQLALHGDGGGACAHGLQADSPVAPGRWEDGACYRWSIAQVAAIVGDDGARLVAQRFALPADDAESGFLAVGAALTATEQKRLPALIQRLAVARTERRQPRRDASVYPAEQAQLACAAERAGMIALADALHPHLTGADPWTGRALAARWRRRGVPEPRALEIAACDLDDDLDPPGGLAPSAVLGHLRLDLASLTGDPDWRLRALALVDRARVRLRAAPLACAGLLSVLDRSA